MERTSRRTRSDVKVMRDQWRKPYISLMVDKELEDLERNVELEDFFNNFRDGKA